MQVGPNEIGPVEVGPNETGLPEVGSVQVGFAGVGHPEVGPLEVCPHEIGPPEVCSLKIESPSFKGSVFLIAPDDHRQRGRNISWWTRQAALNCFGVLVITTYSFR